MPRTVVIGGSVAGLAAAHVLTGLGHSVTVLERDPQPVPDTVGDAHHHWDRPTVPQAHHSHAFGSLGTTLLARRAPDLYAALVDAGAAEIRLGERMPPTLPDRGPRPGDEDLLMLGARRSTFELVLRREVLRGSGADLRPGVVARGLRVADGLERRVTGVRTDDELLAADLVIDAAGRRSPVTRWLAEAGVPVAGPVVEPCEITYYTRFYRSLSDRPAGPLNRGFGAGGLWDYYTAVLFLGDNNTFSISVGVLPDDQPLKALRHPEAFTAAVAATPLLAPWLAPGVSEPISPVFAMAGLDNSLRWPALTDPPPVTGLYAVGDAVCTTNPAYGRGVSLALANAFGLADVLSAHPAVDLVQAAEVHAMTRELFTPWFAEATQNDRGRAMLWRAGVAGTPPPSPPPGLITFGQVAAASATDPVVWRALIRVMMSLEPPSTVYGNDDIRTRVQKALANEAAPPPPALARKEFIELVTAAAG